MKFFKVVVLIIFLYFFLVYFTDLFKPLFTIKFEGYIPMVISQVVEEENYGKIILSNGTKYLEIYISQTQLEKIQMVSNNITLGRPDTHDLVINSLNLFRSKIIAVSIDKQINGIYYATIYIQSPFGIKKLDSRPSDAIILALKLNKSIYVSESLISRKIPSKEPF